MASPPWPRRSVTIPDGSGTITNGTPQEVRAETFEEEVHRELREIREVLDVIARLSCPVCAPAAIATAHPDRVRVDG